MRSIYCDTKDCLNSEIIDSGLHFSRPNGWKDIRITCPGSSISINKEFCPDCVKDIAIFKTQETTENKQKSLEDMLRDFIREEVAELMEGGPQ